MKKFLMYITHLVTNILIQGMLMLMLMWFTFSIPPSFILVTAIILVLLIADYAINRIIQRKSIGKLRFKWLFHLLDLLLAVPGVLLAVRRIILIVYGRCHPTFLATEIAIYIIVLVINALLLTERIVLIRRSNLHLQITK